MQSLQLFSNFNLNILKRFLSIEYSGTYEVTDNSMLSLNSFLSEDITIENDSAELAFIWFSPESISPSFQKALNGDNYSYKQVTKEFEEFFSLVLNLKKSFKILAIPLLHSLTSDRNYGILDLRNNLGIKNILHKLNLLMINAFEENEDIFILDPYTWMENDSFSQKMWYSAKVPYTNEVFKRITLDIKSLLNAREGKTKKLIILDLDNTLWGGVVGDDGWENLRLGGHDHLGEAFVDFQKKLLKLSKKGILLAICSKNTESIALEAISQHPEMILREEDFSSYRINWNDKAVNIESICEELNIGMQSAIFLDDNINERERIKSSFPEIFVPDLPKDPRMFPSLISSLIEFDLYSFTSEDRDRKDLYKQRKKENEFRKKELGAVSIEDWLMSLDISVKVESLREVNLSRTLQLLNKTNQMNLSTRRLTKEELVSWADNENNFLWTFRTSDKFGDSGLTGVVSVSIDKRKATIVDFVLSCRVMGKEIENSMLSFVIDFLRPKGVDLLEATLLPTKKNKPCLDFFLNSQFDKHKENIFHFKLNHQFQTPKPVRIEVLKYK